MENPTLEPQKSKPHSPSRNNAWFGLILILAGLIIFAQQAGWLGPTFNWWALFILIPAFGSLTGAFYAFQASGKVNAAVRSSLGSALILFTLTFIFLLGLDWSVYWPLMVIAPGVSVLLNGFGGRELLNMAFWIGAGAVYLGVGFLGINTGWMDLQQRFEPYNWWAIAILIPAFGAFVSALLGLLRREKAGNIIGLVIFGLLMAATGLIALFSANWSLIGPVLLIVVGVGILLGILIGKNEP